VTNLFYAGGRWTVRRSDRAAVWRGSLSSGQFLQKSLFLIITVLWCALSGVARAAPVTLQGTVDPQRLQQQLAPPAAPPNLRDSYIFEMPETAPVTLAPVQDGFVLVGITVTGSTVFTPEELAQSYHGYLGQQADLGTIQSIADHITRMYRERGYFLSRALVPEQEIEEGKARIVIIEGYVSRVRIEGDDIERFRKKDLAGILDKISAAVTDMRPLNGNALERLLLLANDMPSVNIKAVMEPLPKETAPPGAVGMIISIDKEPRDFAVQVDDFGSRYNGTVELSGTASFNNSLFAFDHASVSMLASPSLREVKAVSASYTAPVTAQGTNVGLRLGYSSLNPGFTLKDFNVQSAAWNIQFLFLQNLVRTRRTNVSVWATLDFADVSTDVLDVNLYKDRIRAVRPGVQFDRTDDLHGTTSASITLSQGLDILGARKTGSANLSRAQGHSDFTKLAATVSRLQDLDSDWQVYMAASGQYAWTPLLSSEQFGYGGQAFGRAYDPAEMTGDHGIGAALELRYTGLSPWQNSVFQPFVFYDIGKVWNAEDSSPDAAPSGASAGGGLRFFSDHRISGSLLAAIPLTRPASAPPSYSSGNGPRLLFQLSSHF
jgi:hemolysin activation/secretion protein